MRRASQSRHAVLHSADSTRITYQDLAHTAQTILEAGDPVVVDAASLESRLRAISRSLAYGLRVPFLILSCHTAEAVLKDRIRLRAEQDRDAFEARVEALLQQVQNHEPLTGAEWEECVLIDSAAIQR